jgi:hypothetical protein
LTIDFVFVVDTTGSMMPAIEACRNIMKDTVTELTGKEILKGKIRFGLVEYRDEDSYVSKVTQTLTNDYVKFQSILDRLEVNGGGDEAEEGLAGLKKAIEEADWDKNSAKYLLLIGDAPLKGKGEQSVGTSGLSFDDIKKLVAPVITEAKNDHNGRTGEVLTALATMNILSMFAVSDDTASNPGVSEGKEQFKRVANKYIEADLRNADGKGKAMDEIKKYCLSFDTLVTIATKGGDETAANEIRRRAEGGDMIAAGLYKILKEFPPEEPVQVGCAGDRNSAGDTVAIKRAMVLRDDLRKFVSQLQALNKRLNAPGLKQNNAAAIVESATEAVGESLSGSKLDTDSNLEDVILKDFPLKVKALDVTPQMIAGMAPEQFNTWKERLKNTTVRLDKIANDNKDWNKLVLPDEIKKEYEKNGESEPEYKFVDVANWDRD